MSSRSLSPGFFDPRNYREDDNERDERDERDTDDNFVVVVPQNAMATPSALASPNALTAMIAWWFASSSPGSSSPGCRCGGERPGITKIYTY